MTVHTRPKVAVADTGSGNLRSVEKALAAAGADVIVTGDADRVAASDKIVVPGQGAFGGCVAGLARGGGGLQQAVMAAIRGGKPYLGICLGLQILFDGSEEDPGAAGLGVLPGRVARFQGPGLKVPHMGWNRTTRPAGAAAPSAPAAWGALPEGAYFYFVHSFYAVPADPRHVALESEHGVRFCAAIARDNVVACQFHPEKSQAAGLALLRAFVAG